VTRPAATPAVPGDGAGPVVGTAGSGAAPPGDDTAGPRAAAPRAGDGARVAPLPPGLPLALDPGVRRHRDGRVLVGGSPLRAMRLTSAGTAAVAALLAGEDPGEAGRTLGRRLVDAGLAHPRPPAAPDPADVTVIVPVRDRAAALDRCLEAVGAGVPIVVVDDGSADPTSIRAVGRRHGATVLRRESSGGPAAARNTALAAVTTGRVAFLDSDCVPEPGWLATTCAHFADPLVGAVAPRVRPEPVRTRAPARERYAAARSPLDMGSRESAVVPGGRVPYVPTAALVVRRQALESAVRAGPERTRQALVPADGQTDTPRVAAQAARGRDGAAFDPALRHGEDVDLVWRLHDAGWRVRLEPHATVRHAEPGSWGALLARRHRYGTSAAPLSLRHPGRLAPLVARPGPAAVAALLLARRPGAAAALAAVQGAVLARRLRRTGVPVATALPWPARAGADTFLAAGRAATMLAAPVLVAALCSRRTRMPALALLAAPPLREWARRRPRLDPVRWTAAGIADDVAYGLGVWRGCVAHRTAAPLKARWR
jgi:mycofactocin glycosyltransferase